MEKQNKWVVENRWGERVKASERELKKSEVAYVREGFATVVISVARGSTADYTGQRDTGTTLKHGLVRFIFPRYSYRTSTNQPVEKYGRLRCWQSWHV